MRKHYGYDSYRGRSPLRTFLKATAVVLAVVLLLGVAALFFLEPYWVVSADGAQLRLPWSQQTPAPSAEPSPFSSSPVVVVTPEIQTPAYLHAAFLPGEALYDGSAAARLTEAGAEAALFDMKTDEGLLHYRSELPLADQAGVNPKDTALNAAILALNGTDGLYTVARVSCFRDNSLPKARNDMAVRSPAGNWRDNGGYRWLSPSSSDAQRYLIDICLELAGLGFDEILLDNAGYPVDGNLDYIVRNDAYDSALFPATVRGFLHGPGTAAGGAVPGSGPLRSHRPGHARGCHQRRERARPCPAWQSAWTGSGSGIWAPPGHSASNCWTKPASPGPRSIWYLSTRRRAFQTAVGASGLDPVKNAEFSLHFSPS